MCIEGEVLELLCLGANDLPVGMGSLGGLGGRRKLWHSTLEFLMPRLDP